MQIQDDSLPSQEGFKVTVKQEGIFRKSSFSNSAGCVEVARFADGSVQVRDTKDKSKTTLTFNRQEWIAFLQGVRNSEFEID